MHRLGALSSRMSCAVSKNNSRTLKITKRFVSTPKEAAATLKIGAKGDYMHDVLKEHTTNRTKRPGDDILMSPTMILWMERASVAACEPNLPKGFATVGWHVDVKHLAPTHLGQTVVAKSTLTEINGTKLTFEVNAFNGDQHIGTGTHRRAVIKFDAPADGK